MGSVYLVSLAFGRQRGSLAPIGCAAAVMFAVSPSVIYSISFQLSFAAIAGIAAFTDMFGDRLRSHIERLAGHRSMLRAPLAGVTGHAGDFSCSYPSDTAAACIPLRARVHAWNTGVHADAAYALPFLIVGSAGTALSRVGEYDVRNAVRLDCVGRGCVLVRRGYSAG